MKTVVKPTEKEILTIPQRWGEGVTIVVMLLLLSFFAYHQAANTGFFTAKFGVIEMFFLYGPILLSLVAPGSRALNGHRNPARPLEAATNMFLAIAALWLLTVFPFNYAHLADV